MLTKYSEDFLKLSAKLVKHCALKANEEILAQSQLTCPKNILEYNVLARIKNFEIEAELMTEEENSKYRELIEEDRDGSSYHDHEI